MSRVNPTMEQKVKIRNAHGILSLEIFSCSVFTIQALKKMMIARNPRIRPDRRGKKPGPGLEKLPTLKPKLSQTT